MMPIILHELLNGSHCHLGFPCKSLEIKELAYNPGFGYNIKDKQAYSGLYVTRHSGKISKQT